MQDDPKNPQAHQDLPEETENEQAERLDNRHEEPGLQTPDQLQHGNRYRPEGE